MSVWQIRCSDPECNRKTEPGDIQKLLDNYLNKDNLFICKHCGKSGYIEKYFKLQEKGGVWNPRLRGAIKLGEQNDTYQPFVCLVSYEPNSDIKDIWFCYYKDTRNEIGGRLRLGYGPGGPPVLPLDKVINLLKILLSKNYITKNNLSSLI
jgi:hypothetical protein